MMNRFIFITTSVEVIHHYPNAPKDVEYLKNPHRHIFHIKMYIEVNTDDREIEFIRFKHYIDSIVKRGNIGTTSCEQYANNLYDIIKVIYPNRKMKIEVSEDGENGSCLIVVDD